jgi:hypothetical protein
MTADEHLDLEQWPVDDKVAMLEHLLSDPDVEHDVLAAATPETAALVFAIASRRLQENEGSSL